MRVDCIARCHSTANFFSEYVNGQRLQIQKVYHGDWQYPATARATYISDLPPILGKSSGTNLPSS
jgi:hypothetical protein